jgi:protein tyrosine/serine phosphatase
MPEMSNFLQDIFKKFHFLKPFSFTFFLSLLVIINGCTNFHEVTPGVLYRSKQLSGSQFDHFIKKFKIKTVINLRGAAPDDKWYQEEIKTTQADNAAHLDIHLSAVCYVPPKKVDSIMSIATAAAKPILVHCQGGADRSGLFCAAWKLKIENTHVEKASKQLSFIYGHIPFFIWSRTEAMDSSFNDYVKFFSNKTIR